ncbi:hypothetical protein HK100_008256 [Physocladia obscura]|uniref:Uncharacterized protein n=1 Tax=Physocladia obscura TaxID=109957 RepID=A0AAD5TBQ9_9FUNG|nr:hypothetical protein HK100_008256 [Physocladia obscura]
MATVLYAASAIVVCANKLQDALADEFKQRGLAERSRKHYRNHHSYSVQQTAKAHLVQLKTAAKQLELLQETLSLNSTSNALFSELLAERDTLRKVTFEKTVYQLTFSLLWDSGRDSTISKNAPR